MIRVFIDVDEPLFKIQSLMLRYLLIRLFISRCIGIGRFIQRLRSVNIMLLLRIQSGDLLRIEILVFVINIQLGMLIRLVRGGHGIQLLQRMLLRRFCLRC